MSIIAFFKVVLLGIIEGITEWLPISSTGHLILADEFIKLNVSNEFMQMFLVVIQLGAIMAVVVLYFKKLWPFCTWEGDGEVLSSKDKWILWGKIVLACLPAICISPFNDFIEEKFNNYVVVATMLIVYGILFILIENYNKRRKPTCTSLKDMKVSTALMIGIFQVLAVVPGTSRSGSTIIGGILIGVSRTVVAEFTFFLGIPVMFGASLLKIVKFGFSFTGTEITILLLGMAVAFLVSILAIKFLMGYIKKHDFKAFGWYRIVLGIVVLGYFIGGNVIGG